MKKIKIFGVIATVVFGYMFFVADKAMAATGSLTVSSCEMQLGHARCPITVSWTTTGATSPYVYISGDVTASEDSDVELDRLNSSPSTVWVDRLIAVFYLKNGDGTVLDSKSVHVDCVSGTRFEGCSGVCTPYPDCLVPWGGSKPEGTIINTYFRKFDAVQDYTPNLDDFACKAYKRICSNGNWINYPSLLGCGMGNFDNSHDSLVNNWNWDLPHDHYGFGPSCSLVDGSIYGGSEVCPISESVGHCSSPVSIPDGGTFSYFTEETTYRHSIPIIPCKIKVGESSCDVTLKWNTNGLPSEATTWLSDDIDGNDEGNNVIASGGHSNSTGAKITVTYPTNYEKRVGLFAKMPHDDSNDSYATNDWVKVKEVVIYTICSEGTVWNGSKCVINGKCGSSNGQTFLTIPTTNLCSTGTPSAVSGSGPWTWSCYGTNGGGSTASCSANKTSECGSSNGQYFPSAPTTNLCLDGTTPTVSGTGPWSWICGGSACNAYMSYSCSNVCSSIYSYVSASFQSSNATCTNPIGAVTYSKNCSCGEKISDPFRYTPYCSVPVVTLSASPSTINSGQSSLLSWTVLNNATSCTTSGGWNDSGIVSNGSKSVSPLTDTTYSLVCSNTAGSSLPASATVNVLCTPSSWSCVPSINCSQSSNCGLSYIQTCLTNCGVAPATDCANNGVICNSGTCPTCNEYWQEVRP
ncbi:MAG: hypothetical protein WA055_03705 [Candidatus Moraniibacteriota bacterium]